MKLIVVAVIIGSIGFGLLWNVIYKTAFKESEDIILDGENFENLGDLYGRDTKSKYNANWKPKSKSY